MKKVNIFLYSLLAVAIIRVGLLFPMKQVSNQMLSLSQKYDDIEMKLNALKHFDDSLATDSHLRKNVLNNASTAAELKAELMRIKENKRAELEKESAEFLEERSNVLRKSKIYDIADILLNMLLVCLFVITLINQFGKREGHSS